MAKLRSAADIEGMKKAGVLVAECLATVGELVKAGLSTQELNDFAHDYIMSCNGFPSSLNYGGFPKSICTSINEVICHGIPDKNVILQEGDIINIDICVTLNGYLADTSKTYYVGNNISPDRRKVTEVAAESLALAITQIKHGNYLGDIGSIIQNYAENLGCGVVRNYSGHGICKIYHEAPAIFHYGIKGKGEKIVRGMTFTVEPMINAGTWREEVLRDKWTVITADKKPSAQFEHTFAVVGEGVEVLTALPNDTIVQRAKELGANILYP